MCTPLFEGSPVPQISGRKQPDYNASNFSWKTPFTQKNRNRIRRKFFENKKKKRSAGDTSIAGKQFPLKRRN